LMVLIVSIELTNPLHGQYAAHEKLSGRLCISSKSHMSFSFLKSACL
jgi:hypothetical protein